MAAQLFAHAHYAWLVTASLIAGGMNAMAGGGSFISFPAMLAMGVPPVQANATNTVAIWPGQLTSVFALRKDLRRDLLPVAILCSVLGGVGGAVLLLETKQSTFLKVLPWLLLLATAIFGFSGRISAWLRKRAEHGDRPVNKTALLLMLLPVCLYIGYFGAGAGFLIMTALSLLGVEEMRELNSMKVTAACVSNLSAVITFVIQGAVVWRYCLISMIFAGLGGWIGARYARNMRADVLRTIVVITGACVAGWFFYLQHKAA